MKIHFVLYVWKAIGINGIVRFLMKIWKLTRIAVIAYVATNASKRRSRRMTIKNDFPCKNCPKKGCGAYHDVCEAYQAFRQKRTTDKSEDAKTRFVANHAPYRIRRMAK